MRMLLFSPTDNEKSRLPFGWFETWQPETPPEEISLNAKMACELTPTCISAPFEYVIPLLPGTCSITEHRTSSCVSKLKDVTKRLIYLVCRGTLLFSCVSAVLLHAWCNTTHKALCHTNERFPIQWGSHLFLRRDGLTQGRTCTTTVCTPKPLTDVKTFPLTSFPLGLLSMCCLPYRRKGQVQNRSPGVDSTN